MSWDSIIMDDCLSANIREIDPEGWGLWKWILADPESAVKPFIFKGNIILRTPETITVWNYEVIFPLNAECLCSY